jgi:hypothetical protein
MAGLVGKKEREEEFIGCTGILAQRFDLLLYIPGSTRAAVG